MEDFQVPKSVLVMVQHMPAVEAPSVLQGEQSFALRAQPCQGLVHEGFA